MMNKIAKREMERSKATRTARTSCEIIESLKDLDGVNLGPEILSNIGKEIAKAVICTLPANTDIRYWITININKIDEIIFENFSHSNLVHALGFAKLYLRECLN